MDTTTSPLKPPPKRAGLGLKILLRYLGTVAMVAWIPVLMPFAWMEGAHMVLGLGTLPTEPVTSYMARSLSMFYAMLGMLLWFISFRPHHYRALLRFLSLLFIIFGGVLVWIDFHEGMPWFWRYAEGPIVIFFGMLMLILTLRLKPEPISSTPPGTAGP